MDNYNQVIEVADPAKGKLKYVRPFIVLVPTLIMCLYNIKTGVPFQSAMWRLLLTILLFYAVGTIAQNIIRKIIMQAEIDAVKRQDEARTKALEESEKDEEEDGEETENEQMEGEEEN